MKTTIFALLLSVATLVPGAAYSDGMHAETASAPASVAGAKLREGEVFAPARARLVKQGWKPVNVHPDKDEYIDPDTRAKLGTFPEVHVCSMDTASCILYYTKAGKCLRVDTVGETIKAMKVVEWRQECFGDADKPVEAAAQK